MLRLSRGQHITCKYPMNGVRNILKARKGTIEKTGKGPNGPYIILNLGDGGYRTLRRDRMIDVKVTK